MILQAKQSLIGFTKTHFYKRHRTMLPEEPGSQVSVDDKILLGYYRLMAVLKRSTRPHVQRNRKAGHRSMTCPSVTGMVYPVS